MMKMLTAKPWRTAAGLALLTACTSGDSLETKPVTQRVEPAAVAGEFTSALVSDASARCANVVDGSSSDGAAIEVYTCVDYGSERFVFSPSGSDQYRIQNELSGLCFDLGPESNGARPIVQRACRDAAGQRFTLSKAANGSYVVHGDGDGCLGVAGSENKSAIESMACNASAEQRFAIAGVPASSASQPPAATDSGPVTPPPPPSKGDNGGASSACGDGTPDGNHPSGQAPPTCSPQGFTLVRVDDMSDNAQGWDFPGDFQYFNSYVERRNTSIHDGLLDMHATFEGNQGHTGWALNKGMVQTYGKYLVRMRGDKGRNLAEAPLLWPASEIWPGDGEIDFAEDDVGDRACYAFSHYAKASGGDASTWSGPEQGHSLADWHTWGVEWTPNALRYTVDGQVWDSITMPEAIPRGPMWLGFVQSCLLGACDEGMNAHWEIDWVAMYSYTP